MVAVKAVAMAEMKADERVVAMVDLRAVYSALAKVVS
jgi:hypothetical protein